MDNINEYLDRARNGEILPFDVLQLFINDKALMIELIKANSEYIIFYDGNDEDVFQAALDNGFELSLEHVKDVSRSSVIMKKAVEINKDYIKYYMGSDISVYIKAMQCGYTLGIREIQKFSDDVEKMKEIIKYNPDYIIDYLGRDESLYQAALDNGFELTDEHIKACQFSSTIIKNAIDINVDYVKYYIGNDISIFIYAINKGYKMTKEDFSQFEYSDIAMRKFVEINPDYIVYYKGNDESLFQLALDNGFKIREEKLIECSKSSVIFKKAINIDFNFIKYYEGNDITVYLDAIKLGYDLSEREFLKFFYTKGSILELLKVKPDYIKYYKGDDEDIFNFALNNGLNITEEIVKLCSISSSIMLEAIDKNKNYIKYYKGDNELVYLKAMEYNYKITDEDFINNSLLGNMDSVMMKVVKNNPDMIIYYTGDNILELVSLTNFSKNIPWTVIKFYKGDKKKLISNYDTISSFLSKLNIREDLFIQYSLGKDYNWLDDILKIVDNNKIDEFIVVKDYFINNIFTNSNSNAQNIENFILILKNYQEYRELILSIVNNNYDLVEDDIRKIKYLFNQNIVLLEEEKPKKLEDFADIHSIIKNKYIELIKEDSSYISIKNIICNILFSSNYLNVEEFLCTYGDTMELIKLAFNDRKSRIVPEIANEMIEYISMMELIVNSNDSEYLMKVLENILSNIDLSLQCASIFNEMDEKMRLLFESDIQEMLTDLDNNKLIDTNKSDEYGVLSCDLSDKDYVLLAHVVGNSEDIGELCNGNATGNNNFICLSSISYRNQLFYHYEDNKIIFGYEEIPNDSFICSSLSNMGSNSYIKENDSEVGKVIRIQRGIVETSSCNYGVNNEYLLYRQGLKPSCIIIPSGRKPSQKEIDIAKEYGLKLVFTQGVNKEIEKPKIIKNKKEKDRFKKNSDVEVLKDIKDKLIPKVKKGNLPRKIAVFTDSHALFEPTLAILESARKEGITEIYSLGDNIGTGPNPSEVLDLLDKYNVKSIMGNHELYAIKGVGKFKEHLDKTGSYHKSLDNSVWTRENITNMQFEKIKMYPRMIELLLGGKKLLLCHSIKSFNSEKMVVDPKEFDEVLQGHIHFREKKDNVMTLGGAGIGTGSGGYAYYVVLTEKPDGGYDIEEKKVKYDVDNLEEDINTSDLNKHDREKIMRWAGISKRKK